MNERQAGQLLMGSFHGPWRFLSNFYPVPHRIHGYPTVEHFYVAMKTTDPEVRVRIKNLETAREAKRFGRQVALREDWNEIKLAVMAHALERKFREGTELARRLLATGNDVLVEENEWHDNYWGRCTCRRCEVRTGHNHLGRLLMERRQALREAS